MMGYEAKTKQNLHDDMSTDDGDDMDLSDPSNAASSGSPPHSINSLDATKSLSLGVQRILVFDEDREEQEEQAGEDEEGEEEEEEGGEEEETEAEQGWPDEEDGAGPAVDADGREATPSAIDSLDQNGVNNTSESTEAPTGSLRNLLNRFSYEGDSNAMIREQANRISGGQQGVRNVPPQSNGAPASTLSPEESASLHMFGCGVAGNVSKTAYNGMVEGVAKTGVKLLKHEQCEKLALRVSGLDSYEFDMCEDSCIAFFGQYANCQACPRCGKGRTDDLGKPVKVCTGQRLLPRIRSLFANPETAIMMRHAALEYEANAGSGLTGDIPLGVLHDQRVRSGLLADQRDSVLTISTDGASIIGTKNSNGWLVTATILSLPPEHRYRAPFLSTLLLIPGPKNPAELETFLLPLYAELQSFEQGLDMFDGGANEHFRWRGLLIGITGDQPAVAKVNGFGGHTAKAGCRDCAIQAASATAQRPHPVYYPMRTPGQQDGLNRDRQASYDPDHLEERSAEDYFEALYQIRQGGSDADSIRTRSGYRREAAQVGFTGWTLRWFNPVDLFHLAFLDIFPLIFRVLSSPQPGDPWSFPDRAAFGKSVDKAKHGLPSLGSVRKTICYMRFLLLLRCSLCVLFGWGWRSMRLRKTTTKRMATTEGR